MFYTCVGGICLSRTEATWSTRPWPSLQQQHITRENTSPTTHQGISDLGIVPTNNCNPHNMWKYSLKPIFVLTLPHWLPASARRAPNCPQNLATFGVGTTIKSIPLTSTHHCSGSLHLKLLPHTYICSNILKIYCNSELISFDLILLKKSLKSGRVQK